MNWWRVLLGAAGAAAVVGQIVAPGSGAVPGQEDAPQADGPAFEVADVDGDQVADDLERQMIVDAEPLYEVIVGVDGPVDEAALDAIADEVGTLRSPNPLPSIGAFTATVTADQIDALRVQPEVAVIDGSGTVLAANAEATLHGGADAVVDALGYEGDGDGDATTYSPGDAVAAVLDSGIDASHPDLDGGKVLAFVDCMSGTCAAVAPFDDHPDGHGTHVAATIAGTGDAAASARGVAPGAALIGIKVLDSGGSGTSASVLAGIQWAIDNKDVYGIVAINLSLQGGQCGTGNDPVSAEVNAAFDAGILAVVAAGNQGPGDCSVTWPGTAENALTVGAAADPSEGGWAITDFSGRGPTGDGRVKPDVVAPGVAITSARVGTSGYSSLSGTSMATPFVTGLAMLAHDADPTADATDLYDAIRSTAVAFGGEAVPNPTIGYGRVDAEAAVGLLLPPLPPSATPTPSPTLPPPAPTPSPPSVLSLTSNRIFVTNAIRSGPADYDFALGSGDDEILVGDWNGDGRTGFAARSGRNIDQVNERGAAFQILTFGSVDDTLYRVGDWDGNGTDTLAVQRGNVFHLVNRVDAGGPVTTIGYGRQGDELFVGDWDGDGIDTFAVRRGNAFYVRNSVTSGPADTVFGYGRAGDEVLVGDWNHDGIDTFAVRRGNIIHIRNDFLTGVAETTIGYGRAADTLLVGDWDGDGIDTFAVRRAEPGG